MPVWHERTRQAVANGELIVLGVIQEQHAARCRLFAQWKDFNWPILQDAINLLGPRAVPIFVALDASGVVQAVNPQPKQFDSFLTSADPAEQVPTVAKRTRRKLYEQILALPNRQPGSPSSAEELRQYGDGLMLWGTDGDLNAAVRAYESAAKMDPAHGPTSFRLGVALRRRYESEFGQADDFQRAIVNWSRALEIQPNQYIWRRRIQQYGPRMIKPYAFYDWISEAQREIRERGEEPVELHVQLTRAERAYPAEQADFAVIQEPEPDADDRIQHDDDAFVQVATTVVPRPAKPGSTVRVHLQLTPNAQRHVHWTNDAGPTTLWVKSSAGMSVESPRIDVSGQSELSHETRTLEFEAKLPAAAAGNKMVIEAYALYYVCEGITGQCVYRRQDVPITVDLLDE